MAPKKRKKNQSQSRSSSEVSKLPIEEIVGLIIVATATVMLLSLLSYAYGAEAKNWIGLIGQTIGYFFHLIFGLNSYLVALFIGWLGIYCFVGKKIENLRSRSTYFSLFILSSAVLICLLEDHYAAFDRQIEQLFYPHLPRWHRPYHLGGAPFYYVYRNLPHFNLLNVFNTLGLTIIFSSTLIISLLFFSHISLLAIFQRFKRGWDILKTWTTKKARDIPQQPTALEKKADPSTGVADFMRYVKLRIPSSLPSWRGEGNPASSDEMLRIEPERDLKKRPSLSRKQMPEDLFFDERPLPKELFSKPEKTPAPKKESKREIALKEQRVWNGDYAEFKLPSPAMLTDPKKIDQSALKKELRKQAEVLEETLSSFGIEAKVGQINCGPTINSFEVHPAIGVKVGKIKSLENDIALNMEAPSIRIIAPIPGKAAVGIEIPNPQPQEVSFKEMLHAYQNGGKKFRIPLLLGKAVNGDYVMNDLTKMPHCIIAGATGSGKSVCINTIIMSIVFETKPDEVQLLMVDPKKVELTPYSQLPHMIAPVITEPHGAYTALQWLVKEMESRYELLKQIGVRNIEAFNKRTINKEKEMELQIEVPEKLPYIVGIIDELADLMMVSNTDIETPIARIAQMARAVGIHLILATQRPSREVITGLIKANFPTRISFKVASRINSQIILDEVGAESLLGNGDMLFLPPGTSHLMRAQGSYVRDEDIHKVIEHLTKQAPTNYRIPSFDNMSNFDMLGEIASGGAPKEGEDSLYSKAFDIVASTGNASTTFLQRKLKIGYARAASLMDTLQQNGVVSAQEGSKARRVLMAKGGELEEEIDG